MSKRLLIAVLTLGLLITFCGGVMAGDAPKAGQAEKIVKINPQASRFNDLTEVPRHQPAFQKPLADIKALPSPTSVLPPPYYCEFQEYSEGDFAYYWTIPDPYGDDYFNMRMTPGEGYYCTLLTAYVTVYPAAFTGTPDMDVIVWDDDGFGYPGTELGRVNVPYTDLPATGTGGLFWITVDMSSLGPLVFTDGEEFHVGVSTTDQVNNGLAILSDDGSKGQLRSSEYWGIWGLMFDDWGVDVNFGIGVDLCCADIPYSECYTQDYTCGIAYFWQIPDAYGDDYFNMRFTAEGPETLTGFDIAFYDGYGDYDSTGGVDAYVWGSDAGFPDLSDVIYTAHLNGDDFSWNFGPGSPNIEVQHFDLTAENIVLIGDFHIGFSTTDQVNGSWATLSDNGSCGTLRSSEYWGTWGTMSDDWGADVNFLISADLCKDEFSLCQTEFDYCGLAYFWRLPDRYGDIGDYQKMSSTGIGCRLEKVRIALYWAGSEAALPLYTYNSEVQVYASDGGSGLPGTLLGSVTVTPADYVLYPAMLEVDFNPQNITFDDDIWVGIESLAPDTLSGIRTLSDNGSCGNLQSCENWAGSFFYMLDDWGVDYNFVMEADACCIPPEERTCTPGEDWPTTGHDFRRTARSENSTGDAQCQQTLLWKHSDGAGFIYGRPIVYDGIVIAPYNDKMQAYDIDTGALLWTIQGLPEIGAGFRNSVTVKDGYVYFGGGNGRSFSKADVYTGAVVWSRNVINNPFAGATTYTTSVILDCGGTEVVYFGTAAGELVALDAATGLNYGGWGTNPLLLDGDSWHSLSSNGVDVIYVGTDGAFGDGNGNLYAIDACTGAINWQITNDGTGTGLLGYDIDGDTSYSVTTEIFQGPIAVDDDGSLYFITSFNDEESGAPSGGYYRVSSAGSVVWTYPGKFQRFTGPVLDANHVIFQSLRGWSSESEQMDALKKPNGGKLWTSDAFYHGLNWVEGALSCEPLETDLYYTGNMDGQFLAVNSDEGTIAFEYNYVVGGSNRGVGAAIDPTHVVFNNRQGDLYVLANDVDRPRLRILKYDELQAVPFFTPDNTIITYDDVFMNNGCAQLDGTITADEIAPVMTVQSVNPARIARMQDAADAMVENSYPDLASNLVKAQPVDPSIRDAEFTESALAKDSYSNSAAYAPPSWLNFIVADNFSLAAGETFSVQYNINGNLVSRGPQRCYVTISSNDQYYLNDAAAEPVVQLGVLGGCLESVDELPFGTAEQNIAPVHNTGERGNQVADVLFDFDGVDTRYWQGGYFYAAEPTGANVFSPPFRMAWTTESWHAADPDDFWNTLLPDPNVCGQCEPWVTATPMVLGYMSHDGGATYDPVEGYAAAYRFIDSVINFDCFASGWDWANIGCAFDNSLTMGFAVDEYMYGVVGEAAFNDVVIYRHDMTNRNHPTPLDGVYVGSFEDFDLEANGLDVWKFDAAHSVAWGSSCANVDVTATAVYGMGKVPMDVDPMIGVRTLDANQAMWHADYVALDSMYYWMTQQPGQTAQAGVEMAWPCNPLSESDDRDAWFSFTGVNFDGNGEYSFGTYLFGYEPANVNDDAYFASLAILVNQFCGFGRGDINGDNLVNLADVVALWNMLGGGNGPTFQHLADVNNDGAVNIADVSYLANWYFSMGPAPVGAWVLPTADICNN